MNLRCWITLTAKIISIGNSAIIEPNVQIFPEFEKYKNAVCCSYVSRNGKMREKARREIMNRIVKKQIKFGVLIFGRGKKHNRYKYYDIGSKAWFCKF